MKEIENASSHELAFRTVGVTGSGNSITGKPVTPCLGKLHEKVEAAGKVRVFAITDG